MLFPERPAAVSSLMVDKILRVFTGSFTVPAADSVFPFRPGEAVHNISTEVPEECFFYGIYSTDGGENWQDFSQRTNTNPLIFSFTDVWGGSRPGLIQLTSLNAVTNPYLIMYKVALIAKNDHQWAEYGESDNIAQFVGPINYTKIFMEDVRDVVLPSDTRPIISIPHNLGYPPTMRSWTYADHDEWLLDTMERFKADGWSQIIITDTDIQYQLSNESNPNPQVLKIYTRIYYDD